MRVGHRLRALAGPGGAGNYVQRVSEAQRAAGHEVFDLSDVPDEAALYTRARELRLEVLHLHDELATVPPPGIPVVRTVHVHTPYCPSATRYLKRPAVPCDRAYSLTGCLWGHAVDRCGSVRPARLAADFRRIWNEMATLPGVPVAVASHFVRVQMGRSGYREAEVQVLPYPAPLPGPWEPPPAAGPPRFLFVGRLVPEKGLAWLLRALAAAGEPCRLDVAGDGYEQPALQRLAAELGLAERVTFHGWLDQAGIAGLMRQARAMVVPSVWHEPAGIVALEAGAAGRAVLGSRVGGLPEYAAEGETALLVPANDVAALAGALERLAADWSLACRLGERGRDRIAAAPFTMAAHFAGLETLYARAAGQSAGL